ncbi:MAG: hypothetical protein QF805_26260, partial [Pirellulaceae bacterium]|nr:hypothetical protein [Pirellulaceae bacterium]
KTGAVVTSHAAKWLHLKNADEALLHTFFKWAEDRTRFSAVDQQTVYIFRAKGVHELLEWNRRTVKVMDQIGGEPTISPYVLKSLEALHADLAKTILTKESELTDDEFLELATSAVARPVIDEIANRIYDAVIETTDADHLRQLLGWSIRFSQSIQDRGLILPSHLERLPSQTSVECVTKLAYLGRPADVEAVDDLVNSLRGGQLVEMTAVLSDLARGGFHSDSTEFLAALGKKLVHRRRELKITRGREELDRAVGGLAIAHTINSLPLAGLYRSGSFSITLCKQSDVSLCLGITLDGPDSPPVDAPLSRVVYDLRTNELVAYQYIVQNPYDELPSGANAQMRFKLEQSANGMQIKGQLALGTATYSIAAPMIKDFSLPKSRESSLEDCSGVYSGSLNGRPFRLTVGRTNRMMTGWAAYTQHAIRLDFPYAFFDTTKNALYLTTERLGPRNAKHIRATLDSRGNLNGLFIVGGTGRTMNLQLKKEEEQRDVGDKTLATRTRAVDAVRYSGRGGGHRTGF